MSEAGTEPEARDRRLVAERRALPDEPGVYLFRDGGDEVIYVGKARSIRKRVASHFSGGNPGMTSEIESIECLVTETESEALIAEQNFIKRYRPRFNVRLRDDKSYPYIGVSLDEDFPRVYFTRERHRPGRAYFGPFSSARRVRETLDLLGRLFQFRTCDGPQPGRRSGSPCLDYYIERCGAPCVGYVDQETYRGSIDGVLDFLSGRYGKIAGELESQMEEASAAQDFERAATLRDRLASVRSLFERQRVSGTPVGSADLIGVATDGGDANAQVFQVRDGVLLERQGFYLDVPEGAEQGEVAAGFLERFYATSPAMPRTVLVGPELAERTDELAERLADRRDGPPVDLRVAERGEMRRLREMAERNARLALGQEQLRREYGRRRKAEALSGLAEALGMQEVPVRIEGFDISNLGGQDTVASMVVFEGGSPKKSDYRRFKVDGRTGPDDYASLGEVLARRMTQFEEQADLSPHDPERDASFAALPGLILIDGGKGQLSSGLRSLQGFLDRGVTVIGLAKRQEEVFLPGQRQPAPIAPDSEASLLLQRVRDEAHRFALGHHRGRRSRRMTESVLDGIRGVGPERKRLLLQHFGSANRLADASRDEIEAVPGLPGRVAREIYEQLHRV